MVFKIECQLKKYALFFNKIEKNGILLKKFSESEKLTNFTKYLRKNNNDSISLNFIIEQIQSSKNPS